MRDTNSRSLPSASTRLEAFDGRDLAQQAQGVEPVPVAAILRPGQLHGPSELVADSVDEILDLHGRQSGFRVQDVVQPGALVVVAQPGFAAAGDQQRCHDRGEERAEILPEERRAGAGGSDVVRLPAGRGPGVIR